MTTKIKERKDAWNTKSDETLAKIVLKHIEQGKSQQQAFQEAGEQLGRSKNACDWRWNKILRSHYETAVEIAKSKAAGKKPISSKVKEQTVIKKTAEQPEVLTVRYSIPELFRMLQEIPELQAKYEALQNAFNELEVRHTALQHENEQVKNENYELKQELQELERNYQLFLEVAEKAKRPSRVFFIEEQDSLQEKKIG